MNESNSELCGTGPNHLHLITFAHLTGLLPGYLISDNGILFNQP